MSYMKDCYVVVKRTNDNERELYHALFEKSEKSKDHKYIRREWQKGRWRYWYKIDSSNKNTNTTNATDTLRTNLKTNVDNAKNFIEKKLGLTARKEVQAAKVALDRANSLVYANKKNYDDVRDRASEDNYINSSEHETVKAAEKSYNNSKEKNEKIGKEYVSKIESYMKTPIGKIEKFAMKGKDFISETIKAIQDSSSDDYDEIKRQARYNEAEKNTAKRKEYMASQEKERHDVQQPLLDKIKKEFDKLNPFPSLKVKTKATTYDEDMAAVNPNYERGSLYDQNCAVCSITYDLRRRGYDVTAESELSTVSDGSTGLNIFEITKMYDDPNRRIIEKLIDVFDNTSKELDAMSRIVTLSDLNDKYGSSNTAKDYLKNAEKEMLSYGEGSRGNLGVEWTAGGGHSVVWEVCNGEVVVRDCQTNETYNLDYYADYINKFYFIRTDNLIPNDNVLKYVKNRR